MNQITFGLAADRGAEATHAPVPASSRREPDRRRLRLKLYVLQLASDALFMTCAFLLADAIRFGSIGRYGAASFMVLFPIYVAVGFNGGAWSMDGLASPRRSAVAATKALVIAISVATVLFFSLKVGEDFSRLVFGIGSCLALALIASARLALGRRIGERCDWSFRKEILLVDGVRAAAAGGELIVDARARALRPDANDPAMLDRLARVLDGTERVVLACSGERRNAWARVLAGANVDVELLAPELDAIGAIGLRRHGEIPTLLVGCGPLSLRDRILKRLFDLAVSTAALLALSPVMLLAALAIRVESAGPILFRQMRMGRGNRLFAILKFRTMRCDAVDQHGDRSVERGDDRVTRVGGFLRRTSIDELPQLFNVLKGEMSIVGPRPHALGTRAEDQLLWTIDSRYWDRHAIKPGLTGLAQVRGFRGATVTRSDVTARVQSDLEYVEGWHIGRDVAIVLRTLRVLVHANAF